MELSTTEEMKFLLVRLFCQGHGSEVQWLLDPLQEVIKIKQ